MTEPNTRRDVDALEHTWIEEASNLDAPDLADAVIAIVHATEQEDARARRDAVWAISAAVALCSASWLLAWYASSSVDTLMIALPN